MYINRDRFIFFLFTGEQPSWNSPEFHRESHLDINYQNRNSFPTNLRRGFTLILIRIKQPFTHVVFPLFNYARNYYNELLKDPKWRIYIYICVYWLGLPKNSSAVWGVGGCVCGVQSWVIKSFLLAASIVIIAIHFFLWRSWRIRLKYGMESSLFFPRSSLESEVYMLEFWKPHFL